MPTSDRSDSRDRVRQAHSSVDLSRSSIPMWDSSDPERAPPPLPLNPGLQSPTTKPNTSSAIAAAAQQIIERARESTPVSSYTSNASGSTSPERSLVKGAHHKRMQSLQTNSVKDLRSYIDNNRSPERSPERPASSSSFSMPSKDYVSSLVDKTATPTPLPRDVFKDTPSLRPITRPPPRPILGENTPPSSTMLALQTMKVPDDLLNDRPSRASSPATPRVSSNYDFSSQLLNLTNIATNLQKEMAAISRRSKDNATDLLSLKEATLARDEDIRKGLRDLSTNVTSNNLLGPSPTSVTATRSASSRGNLFLDSKAFDSPPSTAKPWSMPRVSSVPNLTDDVRAGSPSPYSVEGAASIAMLEKIIREMVTKEGQDRLLSTLNELFEKSSKENTVAARKVEELAAFIKNKSEASALVQVSHSASGAPQLDLSVDSPTTRITASKLPLDGADSGMTKEIFRLLQRIKDSIGHAGGATAEVKGLVRDMRGEVLGMGRELGRKLDQVSEAQLTTTLDRSIEDSRNPQGSTEVHRALHEGLDSIKSHITGMIVSQQPAGRGTERGIAVAPAIDNEQIYSVVKHALVDHQHTLPLPNGLGNGIDRDAVLEAVKEGLRDFEPNIELQQFGLERDEILKVLHEGLEQYQNTRNTSLPSGIDRAELYETMQEAMKDFQPGLSAESVERMRQDILGDVREALLDFQSTSSTLSSDSDATRVAIIEAVKDGVAEHGANAPRELEISREDLFDAVKASLDFTTIPFDNLGDKVLARLQDLVDGMHIEFKQYSTANGRDTEQVLDAVKDGLECLRADIENYVNRAQDITGKDEIVGSMHTGLEQLRRDVQGYCMQSSGSQAGSSEILDYIKAEFEHLHATIGSTGDRASTERSIDILHDLKENVDALHARSRSRSVGTDFSRDMDMEALKDEFDQLKVAILSGHAADKGELIETIQDSLGSLHSRLNGSELSTMSAGTAEELLRDVRHQFAQIKESLGTAMDEGDRSVIITSIKQSIDDLRTQLVADQSDASAEAIGTIKEELELFRTTMSSTTALTADNTDHASLVAIREALEEIRETVGKRAETVGISGDLLEAIRGEFESVRSSVGMQSGSNEEVVDTIRVGLDDLRSALEKKIDAPGRHDTQQTELLDMMSEGLDTLRTDVLKTLDKPLDMTVNYEILDTLKEGLASLKAELDVLRPSHTKSGQVVLADGGILTESSRDINLEDVNSAPTSANSSVEVLLTQLQIKVEALSASVQDSMSSNHHPGSSGAVTKQDLESIESGLKDLQETVLLLSEKDSTASVAPEGAATKADTDAIETLLRNTKAHLEDMVPAEAGAMATKEHLDTIESMISLSAEVMEALKEKVDDSVASKADLAVVEVLVQDSNKVLEDIKDKVEAELLGENRMTKADLDVLGILCTDIKTKLVGLDCLVAGELPTKADIDHLTVLLSEFRESHDKLKDSYESDIAITAKAFDDRKEEHDTVVRSFDEVRTAIMEAKVELMVKLEESDNGLNTLGETLKNFEDKTTGGTMALEVAEILETVKSEFEKTQLSLEAFKVDHEHSANSTLEKQGEHRQALVQEIGERLDTLFDGLMSKYDDAQAAAAESAKAQEERNASNEVLFMSTKEMTDDLKLSIDTLGTAMTTFTANYPDTIEKMASDSKMVFNRVDDACNKLDETQSGLQHEHTVTREEVLKVMTAMQGLQSDISEHNPRVMMTLREVQALIAQHFEHSQKASEAASEHVKAMRDLQQALKVGLEDAKEHSNSQTETLRGAMPALLPAPDDTSRSASSSYDDSAVHLKLDQIVDQMRKGGDTTEQLTRLDAMHAKLMATAAEVSTFMSRQTEPSQSDRSMEWREAEASSIDIERRTGQRDQLEADIAVLDEEKEHLQAEIDTLKAEHNQLVAQKLRAATELSSVHTALEIRREELHTMENKAEAIERRMMEGVMNQSRMLLLAKATRSSSPSKRKPQGRDLRIASNTSSISAMTTSTLPPLQANHALTFKARPTTNRTNLAPNAAERRIMSLSQINHNLPTGANAFTSNTGLAAQPTFGVKRSHSVKTGIMRKASWAGSGKKMSLSGYNKENENETLSEEDEEDDEDFQSITTREDEEFSSDAGTQRRMSSSTHGEHDDASRLSYVQSEDMYDGSSYMTGSELDGHDSLGSVDIHRGITESEASLAAAKQPNQLRLEAPPVNKAFYMPASDSGIGTDLPTAALSPSDNGAFFNH